MKLESSVKQHLTSRWLLLEETRESHLHNFIPQSEMDSDNQSVLHLNGPIADSSERYVVSIFLFVVGCLLVCLFASVS